MRSVSEQEFSEVFTSKLKHLRDNHRLLENVDYVTGPGRSGAIAAVYASHFLGLPFVPYKHKIEGKRALVVDTAIESGATLRKASRLYGNAPIVYGFSEPPRVKFWYEELSLVRGKGNEYKPTTDDTTYSCTHTLEIDWNSKLFIHLAGCSVNY